MNTICPDLSELAISTKCVVRKLGATFPNVIIYSELFCTLPFI